VLVPAVMEVAVVCVCVCVCLCSVVWRFVVSHVFGYARLVTVFGVCVCVRIW
jgi:hypothetical protein